MSWYIDDQKYFSQWILSIVRKYGANLTKSVIRDFEGIIDEYELRGDIVINKTERTYSYGWRTVEFIWSDDPQKARGPRRDILYCNEGNELTPEDWFQLSIRTRYKCFIDFNPDDDQIWINTDLEMKRAIEEKDVNVIISTYKDNPFLEERTVKEIERLANIDENYWKIYGCGEYGRLEWVIFSFTEIDAVPDWAKFLWYGLDFGYTNDPSACVKLYEWNWCLLYDEIIYQTGLTNSDLCKLLRENWIENRDDWFGDSSEPKSIEEISREWFNIKSVEKGPDSIMFGIDLMKQYPMLVTKRSVNLKKELRKYIWAKDKYWKNLNKPIDAFNHAIDAARYITMMKKKKQQGGKFRLVSM